VRLVTSLLAAAVVATGISAFASNPGRADVPPSATPSASAAMKAVSVDIKDFAYAPPTITVGVGEKITFKNTDAVAHTVSADDKSFDSGNMDQNATWSHVFATAGTYKYTCAYHAFMHGTIIVK
jgi:plastocyanin